MATLEELQEQISDLKKSFENHLHVYSLAWGGGTPTSKPQYEWKCPRCQSMKKPLQKNGRWYCPDCGREYTGDDCNVWFYGVPYLMPRGYDLFHGEDPKEK